MKNFERISLNSQKLLNNKELIMIKGGTAEGVQHICRVLLKWATYPEMVNAFIPEGTTNDCEYLMSNSQLEIDHCYYCVSND
jgi:hypothetical protein